jgi:hypothetical protein
VAAAAREGFAANVRIFLDQEEGGRLLPEQAAYLFAWVDAVRAGGARTGVYCSGIDVPEGHGTISTARDIVEREAALAKNSSKDSERRLALWIAGMHAEESPVENGCDAIAQGFPSGLAICAVSAAGGVQPRLPCE